MFDFLVTADGGLTTAGYVVSAVVGIALFVGAVFLAGKHSEKKKLTTKQLVFCAVALALAFATSYVRVVKMPWGGSVTLCSMLFIVLVANWYGVATGMMVGFVYGLLQFLQACLCGAGTCRTVRKEQTRACERIYTGCVCAGSVPCTWRISLLDGLYAGKLPEIAGSGIPDSL